MRIGGESAEAIVARRLGESPVERRAEGREAKRSGEFQGDDNQ